MKRVLTLVVAGLIAAIFFTPQVMAGGPSPNDICVDADGPLAAGMSTAGSTTDATIDDAGFCGTSITGQGSGIQ